MLQLDSIMPNPNNSPTFDLTVVMPDNSVQERPINTSQVTTSADGTHSVINLGGNPLPVTPMPQAEWIAVDNQVAQRFFQTIMVGSDTPGQYHVTAVSYDPTKFDQVELGITFPVAVYSLRPLQLNIPLPPPSNVSAQDYWVGEGNTTVLRVTVSWQPPSDMSRVIRYEVAATSASFQRSWIADLTSYDIDNLVPDTYAFAVRSIGRNGEVSAWVNSPDVVVDGQTDPPQQVLGLTAVGGTRRIMLNWTQNAERYLKWYEVWRAPAVGADPGLPTDPGNPGAPGSWTMIAQVSGTTFLDASAVMLPNTIWWYQVRAVTTTDTPGTFSAPAWAKTTLLIADDLNDGIINTAKFASSLKPVQLIDNLAAPGLLGDMAYNKSDGQLYTYEAGPPAGWYPMLDLSVATGQITTTQISDNAITTPKINALAIDSSKLAANSVIAGKIQAGAISATEIATGAIRTTHLAADFQLTRSAQIGTAVIGTAQIDYLAVGTSNLKDGAITSTAAIYTGTNAYGQPNAWMSIYTDGSPIIIWGTFWAPFNAPVNGDGQIIGYGRILQTLIRQGYQGGDDVILQWINQQGVGDGVVPFTVIDQPGIGTFNFAFGSSTPTVNPQQCTYYMLAVVLKK